MSEIVTLLTDFDWRMALLALSIGIVITGYSQLFLYGWCLPHAFLEINRRTQRDDEHAHWDVMRSRMALPISIIVPAYNEQATIHQSVLALLNLHYPDFQVIVVNDGSKDKTADVMREKFEMTPTYVVRETETITHKPIRQIYRSEKYPRLLFIDKENGKKADAINTGLTCVRTPLFCVIDADSLLEPEALLRAVRPFSERSRNVIAVGGTVGIVNGSKVENGRVIEFGLPKNFLACLQVIEYMRAFYMARLAASRKGSLIIISGAFGIFRRDVAQAIGGYDTTTVGEDAEFVIRMHRYMLEQKKPYVIQYVPEPVCWTEAPEDLKFLGNQRMRWQRGALECLARHRDIMFRREYGRLGLVSMPTMFLVDFLSPVCEFLGYILMIILLIFGILSWQAFVILTALIFSFGIFITIGSLFLEQDELERLRNPKDLLMVLGMAFIENFGYRQLTSYWRIRGLYQHLRGMTPSWGAMERRGFNTTAVSGEQKPAA